MRLSDEQIKKLKEIRQKPPRTGVHYTKIVPDKTKYSRKDKYKKSLDS